MPLTFVESVLGGLGLFLLGMRIMSDGIRTVSDDRIRNAFAAITANRLYSLLFGLCLSLLLHSANAAVILTIGLANGGILTIFQTLSVLAGALVGASLTLHLPWVPYSVVATPLILVGVLLKYFARRRRLANAGDLLLGAGLLFLGLTLLEGGLRPSQGHPLYQAFSGAFSRNPLLAMLFGSIISCFVQSTLSFVSVVSSLVPDQHLMPSLAGSMVLGGVIGVAVIAALAAIGGTSASRRSAGAFLLICGVTVLPLVAVVPYLLQALEPAEMLPGGGSGAANPIFGLLASVHTVVSLLTALLLSGLSGLVARYVSAARQDGRGEVPQPRARYLDMRILNTPTLAIEQGRKEIVRMVSVASRMYGDVTHVLFDFDARRADTIHKQEQVLDSLNHEITVFLAALAHATKNPAINYEIPGLLQTVTDLEHMGDRCEHILDCIVDRKEAHVIFSEDAMTDLRDLSRVVSENVSRLELLVSAGGGTLESEELRRLKNSVVTTLERIKQHHFERISSGICPPRAAMLFNEITAAFARIADLCWNIMTVQGRKQSHE